MRIKSTSSDFRITLPQVGQNRRHACRIFSLSLGAYASSNQPGARRYETGGHVSELNHFLRFQPPSQAQGVLRGLPFGYFLMDYFSSRTNGV